TGTVSATPATTVSMSTIRIRRTPIMTASATPATGRRPVRAAWPARTAPSCRTEPPAASRAAEGSAVSATAFSAATRHRSVRDATESPGDGSSAPVAGRDERTPGVGVGRPAGAALGCQELEAGPAYRLGGRPAWGAGVAD